MHLRQLILAAALVVTPLAMIASPPAQAAQSCSCTDINLHSGVCRKFGNCHPVEMSAPAPQPFRKSCPVRKQAVVCDFDSCSITCDTAAKSGM